MAHFSNEGYQKKIPFYQAYPMEGLLGPEEEDEKDMAVLKEMYPKKIKEIQQKIEAECDKLEYEGSMMFDEYPDKNRLQRLMDTIYESVKDLEAEEITAASDVQPNRLFGQAFPPPPHQPRPPYPGRPLPLPPPPPPPHRIPLPPGRHRNNWLRDIVEVLLYQELYNRRCRYRNRRCRRRDMC